MSLLSNAGLRHSIRAKPAISTQTAGDEPAVVENHDCARASDRSGDPLLQLLLRRGADLARGHLAALENHHAR